MGEEEDTFMVHGRYWTVYFVPDGPLQSKGRPGTGNDDTCVKRVQYGICGVEADKANKTKANDPMSSKVGKVGNRWVK